MQHSQKQKQTTKLLTEISLQHSSQETQMRKLSTPNISLSLSPIWSIQMHYDKKLYTEPSGAQTSCSFCTS